MITSKQFPFCCNDDGCICDQHSGHCDQVAWSLFEEVKADVVADQGAVVRPLVTPVLLPSPFPVVNLINYQIEK